MAGMVPSDLLMKRVSSPAPRGLLTSFFQTRSLDALAPGAPPAGAPPRRPPPAAPSRQPRRRTARPRSPRHASRRGRTEPPHAGALPPRTVAPPLCRHAAAQREAPRLAHPPLPRRRRLARPSRRLAEAILSLHCDRIGAPPSSYSSTCFMREAAIEPRCTKLDEDKKCDDRRGDLSKRAQPLLPFRGETSPSRPALAGRYCVCARLPFAHARRTRSTDLAAQSHRVVCE